MIPLTYRIRIWKWFWTTFFPWRVKTEKAIYDQNTRFRALQDSLIENIGTRPTENEREIGYLQTAKRRNRQAIDKVVADLHTYAERVEKLRQTINHVKRVQLRTLQDQVNQQENRLRDMEARFSNAFPSEAAPEVIDVDEMGIDIAGELAARAEAMFAERPRPPLVRELTPEESAIISQGLENCVPESWGVFHTSDGYPTREDYEGDSE